MPRSIVLANDWLYAAWDSRGVMRELCTGGIGGPNHLNGNPIRFGLFADGQMRWLEDWYWDCDCTYQPESLAGRCTWEDSNWSIEAAFSIDSAHPMLSIRIKISNRSGHSKEIRLFLHEDLSIGEFDIGDTAMFQPQSQSILHWKDDVCIAFAWADGGPDGYACGITRFGDAEGVWRDADDGELSGNPIAQGSVDSVQYRNLSIAAGESKSLDLVVSVHRNVFDPPLEVPAFLKLGHDAALNSAQAQFESLRETARQRLPYLPPRFIDFAARCLQILLAHCDPGGAIIAANDSFILSTNRAHYRYCWMRDGAEISAALSSFGIVDVERRFFDFCLKALHPQVPFFLQKYCASGEVGATWHPWIGPEGSHRIPLQADETARVVRFASEAFLAGRLREEHVERLILPCAGFLARFANVDSGMCLPSYDLWEERWGIHAATVAETAASLHEAAKVARAMDLDSDLLELSFARMVLAYQSQLLDASGVPARMQHADGFLDRTADASCLLPFLLPECDSFGSRMNTRRFLEKALELETPVGGWARYEGDYYFRRYEDLPGNAWVITTLWAARTAPEPQVAIETAIDWAIERSRGGTIAEQYDPRTGEPLSVSPLAWSHSEVLSSMIALNDSIAAGKSSDGPE